MAAYSVNISTIHISIKKQQSMIAALSLVYKSPDMLIKYKYKYKIVNQVIIRGYEL